MIDFSEHFCKGDKLFKGICFECKYPKENRDKMLIEEINKLRSNISKFQRGKDYTIDEQRILMIIEDKDKKIKELNNFLGYWKNRSIRVENKIMDVSNLLKIRINSKLYKKVDKIFISSSEKYNNGVTEND